MGEVTQTTPGQSPNSVPLQGFIVSVEAGPDAVRSVRASDGRIAVGAHKSNQLVLTDPSVSRFHCEIWIDGETVSIRDSGSHNGTEVDGVTVVEARLRNGSLIRIGQSRLRFRLLDDPQEVHVASSARFGRLVGESLKMRAVFAKLELAAASDITVLLTGETGTGKEVAAESIHRESARRRGPFVVVDCGAIPRDLVESELFGHRAGAFTGAHADREGAFQAAAGGTLFLDEVGELPHDLQPKLLRALDQRSVRRVGDTRHTPVDVRLVAATNRDLKVEVNERRFRPDLYYRLAVLEVHLPSLRERRGDLSRLVPELLERMSAPAAEAARLMEAPFLAELEQHPWPGNIRELRNYLERCLVQRHPLPKPSVSPSDESAPPETYREARARWMTEYLDRLLAFHGGNVANAAKAADIDRIHLYRLLRTHGLR